MTVKDALHFRESRPEGVTTCTIDETIETIANRLVKAEVSEWYWFNIGLSSPTIQVHRLVVVNGDSQPIGILSLSDLLSKIVLKPKELIVWIRPHASEQTRTTITPPLLNKCKKTHTHIYTLFTLQLASLDLMKKSYKSSNRDWHYCKTVHKEKHEWNVRSIGEIII